MGNSFYKRARAAGGNMITALIDGDILLYQAAYQSETEVYFEESDEVMLHGDFAAAKKLLAYTTANVVEAVGADNVLVCLTDSENFRKGVLPTYKANRAVAGSRKPMGYKLLRAWYESEYRTLNIPTLEADDVMGIMATVDDGPGSGTKIICSIDKDMLTIPAKVYNWDHPEDGIITVSEASADVEFFYQTLVGDSTDNYKGCPGVGPKTARKILGGVTFRQDMWGTVVETFEKKGLTEEDALAQARCARILRADGYNFDTKEVLLWTP
jgi:DNA polymerase-1